MWWRSVIATGILFGVFFALVPNVLWIISWILGKIFSIRVPYAPFGWTALGLVVVLWGMLVYGNAIGRHKIVVNEVDVCSLTLRSCFEGLKVVHISDLHVDSFDDRPEDLEKIIETINAQKADLVLFTGDMVTTNPDGVRKYAEILKKLNGPVYSVLGNHDFFIYEFRERGKRLEAADWLTNYERDTLGWTVLRNEHVVLERGDEKIAIAGVDNINGNQGFPTIQMGDLSKAMDGLDGIYTILMTHDPSHWEAEVLPKSHAEITLSGHTHAAQVRLLGWSLANLTFRQCDGRYMHGDRMLYVNAGIGCTAPFRIGCPSEITVFTLHAKSLITKEDN